MDDGSECVIILKISKKDEKKKKEVLMGFFCMEDNEIACILKAAGHFMYVSGWPQLQCRNATHMQLRYTNSQCR